MAILLATPTGICETYHHVLTRDLDCWPFDSAGYRYLSR